MGYRCKNCNSTHPEEVEECSFCGMNDLLEEKSAGDLLDEMGRMFG